MGPVEIAGVDVVDTLRHSIAKHGDGGFRILRRPEHAGPSQLHGAIAHAMDGLIAESEGSGGRDL